MNERERQIEQVILEFRECGRQLSFDNIEHLAQLIAALPIVCDEMVWEEIISVGGNAVSWGYTVNNKLLYQIVASEDGDNEDGDFVCVCELEIMPFDSCESLPEAKAACRAHLNETVNAMKGGGK